MDLQGFRNKLRRGFVYMFIYCDQTQVKDCVLAGLQNEQIPCKLSTNVVHCNKLNNAQKCVRKAFVPDFINRRTYCFQYLEKYLNMQAQENSKLPDVCLISSSSDRTLIIRVLLEFYS